MHLLRRVYPKSWCVPDAINRDYLIIDICPGSYIISILTVLSKSLALLEEFGRKDLVTIKQKQVSKEFSCSLLRYGDAIVAC